jgi:hypothetical protein
MHHPLVVPNVFQDNAEPLLIMLKQVQNDEDRGEEKDFVPRDMPRNRIRVRTT